MSKTALITGGAKRIGRAISLSLAEQGFDIIIHYSQSEKEAEELVLKLRNLKVNAFSIKTDLLNDFEISSLASGRHRNLDLRIRL